MTAPSKPKHLTWRIMVFQKETCQFKLLWPVTSSFGLIKISTVRNHHYTTGLIFWRISVIVSYIEDIFEINVQFVHKNKITTGTACAVERDEDRHSIWEHPTMQTYDPWGLGSGQSESTTRIVGGVAGFGRHTAFINEPCAILKPDCIFLFTHTVVRSIECATSII